MPAEPYLREVADGVYAYVQPDGGWCVSNAGVVSSAGRTAVIDTAATEARARALHAAVTSVAAAPDIVVNTHHHGDHTFGNAAFPGATVVAHREARGEMETRGAALRAVWPEVDWGDLDLVLPSLTFEDRLTVHVADRPLQLRHVGPAHTTNDVIGWLPDARVLFTGDVVMPGCAPFVLMGSLEGTLRALRRLRALEPRTVVGGHGEVTGPEVFAQTEACLLWTREVAAEAVKSGLSPLEAAREAGPGPYAGLRDPERLVANLHRAFQEAAGGVLGAHLPSAPVFREMVEYNGGRPLRCLA
ncbi:MBL fold metallo-hydrolase [Streptomyces sp. NPDC001034]|uniref:MBL fold metallo-hydrolase n=1 Tax=Streptomyces sp. NPDC001034 TaxID=3154375 RepID=UPI003317D265